MNILHLMCIIGIIFALFPGVDDGNNWKGDKDGGDKDGGDKDGGDKDGGDKDGGDKDGISADLQVDVKPEEDVLLPSWAPGDENIREHHHIHHNANKSA